MLLVPLVGLALVAGCGGGGGGSAGPDAGSGPGPNLGGSGTVTTLAGSGTAGSADAAATAASFNGPFAVAVDTAGTVYVAEFNSHLIRKVTTSGVVSTLAGTAGSSGSANGTGAAARFNSPEGVAVDAAGNLYVADTFNHLIRKITSTGVVTTLAGTAGSYGNTNATGTAASFNGPSGVAVDSSGTVYVADGLNNMVRKISATGVVTTLAGSGALGSADGTGVSATFSHPYHVAVDTSGNVYVTEPPTNLVRKITPAGVVTTLAGTGAVGSTDGTGTAASFSDPMGVAVDASGNVYVASIADNLIRKITPAAVVTTLAGMAGKSGNANGAAASATFRMPRGLAVDASGNVYVADSANHLIRKIGF